MQKTARENLQVFLAICCLCAITPSFSLFAQENGAERRPAASQQAIRTAASRAVRLVEQTSAKFLKTRECFTCHTQTLSAIVLRDARERGFDIDEQNLKRQVERVSELHRFTKRREPGGLRVDTVGYGLWALDVGQHVSDAMTEDMTWYLLNYQKALGHWKTTVHRPPTEASNFTTNYVAIRGLKRYGTAEQAKQIAERTSAVEQWLTAAEAADTEDQVFRLRLAHELKICPAQKYSFVKQLLREQRDHGGWAQKPNMPPDAYATGSVLVALHEAGGLPVDHSCWQRGIEYLLQTQKPDGSWHVVTRSKPEQVYFESGFPHGKDQFISAFATGWATAALLYAMHEED